MTQNNKENTVVKPYYPTEHLITDMANWQRDLDTRGWKDCAN